MSAVTDIVWPSKRRDVLNHHQDSTNWDAVDLREGDVVAANWAKAGITWLQQIVVQLLNDGSPDVHCGGNVVWPDWWSISKADLKAWAASYPGRRVFKCHLPADSLTLSPKARYLYIGRDARDVVWSLHPHVLNYTQELIDGVNSAPHRDWPEDWPACSQDIHRFYADWLDRDGHPYWPFWSSVQSWWDVRDLPNVMLVHHQTLAADPQGEIRRIAAFIGAEPSADGWDRIFEHTSFDWMKAHPDKLLPIHSFKDRGATFMNKGVNGRWRDVLSSAEIARCDEEAARHLTPDCARWLATGK